ncbi:MAG: LacI family transcriptional regulator [Gammaproteobacteria bacterium]|nr:MAG: LacI family transcriptional regulator [Gammaproteobacteria bacterium]
MPLSKPKSTISDVARVAGVSKKTVSRVLNRSPHVGEQTRQRVLAAMAELNYLPSPQARGLASRRSFQIGLVYDNPDPLYIDTVQRGLLAVCAPAGYDLVVHPCRYGAEDLVDDVRGFIDRSRVDGVVILPPLSELQHLAEALREAGHRYVRLASASIDDPRHIVVSDERAGVARVAEYLVGLGHRRIGFISGPKRFLSARERREGFEAGLQRHGLRLAEEWVVEGEYDFDSGKRAALELLRRPERPTAIFASNDDMAAGTIHAAAELGLRVPQDLSVAGFDDSKLASVLLPPLTTVRRPVKEMASLAARKLIETFTGGAEPPQSGLTIVKPEVVIRASTAAPPAA